MSIFPPSVNIWKFKENGSNFDFVCDLQKCYHADSASIQGLERSTPSMGVMSSNPGACSWICELTLVRKRGFLPANYQDIKFNMYERCQKVRIDNVRWWHLGAHQVRRKRVKVVTEVPWHVILGAGHHGMDLTPNMKDVLEHGDLKFLTCHKGRAQNV